MKLTYHQNGDYLLPDLGLTEAEQRPLGKYGRMHLRYLEEHRPGLYTRLLLSGKLMEHLKDKDPAYYYSDILIPNGKTLRDFINAA